MKRLMGFMQTLAVAFRVESLSKQTPVSAEGAGGGDPHLLISSPPMAVYLIVVSLIVPGGGILGDDCNESGVDDALEIPRLVLGTTPRVHFESEVNRVLESDFNADGRVDLVAFFRGSTRMAVLLGREDGSFYALPWVQAGGVRRNFSVVASDLDGDGRVDLLSVDLTANKVNVYEGAGDGTFQWLNDYPTGGMEPESVALADFDGDGRHDLAVHHSRSGGLVLFLTEAGGSLGPPQPVDSALNNGQVIAADVDSNGTADLLTTSRFQNSVYLYLGEGDGTFQPVKEIGMDTPPGLVLTGNFDNDENLDLVVTSEEGIHLFSGTGSGSFLPARLVSETPFPLGLDVADLNDDGQDDVAVSAVHESRVEIYLSMPDGSFSIQSTGTESGPQAVLLVDLDDDGDADLVTANEQGQSLSIISNDGAGGFLAARSYDAGVSMRSLQLADVDGDGDRDVVALNRGDPGVLYVYLRGENGALTPLEPQLQLRGNIFELVPGDFDGDADLDLLFIQGSPNTTLGLALGVGDGTFAEPVFVPTEHSFFVPMIAVDLDGDGNDDLVSSDLQAESSSLLMLSGRGNGTFGEATRLQAGERPVVLHAGDLDLDGSVDLVTQDRSSGLLSVLWGDGSGGTSPPQLLLEVAGRFDPRQESKDAVVSGDVNGDSLPDIVATLPEYGTVFVYLGLGHRGFTEGESYSAGGHVDAVALGDLDGDGALDIALPAHDGLHLSVLRGDGLGNFARAEKMQAPPLVDLAIDELDSDESPDILALGRRRLWVFENLASSPSERDCNGNGIPDSCDLSSGVSLDIDGDGVPDVCQTYAPSLRDCNSNGVPDLLDLTRGDSEDCDKNGIPDDCEMAFTEPVFRRGLARTVLGRPVDLVSADFDGDGNMDLACTHEELRNLSLLLGTGNGSFRRQDLPLATLGYALVTVDLDGNGTPDLATANRHADSVSVLLNQGDANFTPALQLPGDDGPTDIEAGDFNRDGIVDLVVTAAGGTSRVSVYLGLGEGEFDERRSQSFPRPLASLTADPWSAAVLDLDSDGSLDVVTGNVGAENLAIFHPEKTRLIRLGRFARRDARRMISEQERSLNAPFRSRCPRSSGSRCDGRTRCRGRGRRPGRRNA